jgi:alpha-L-arabinofuranosidase
VIRWPGGNFADYYDWKDGVGPVDSRPRRYNMWSNVMPATAPAGPQRYDPNQFGTPEFMRLCQACGGRPFLNANVRSLPAQEFARWIEYCNAPAGSTTLADVRKNDGSTNAYGVRYWGIGNEVWAAGGDMTVDEYAGLYKRFTINAPKFDGELAFIACGGPPPSVDMTWTRRFLEICKRSLLPVPVAAMSVHFYATNPLEDMLPGETVEQLIARGVDLTGSIPSALAFGAPEWYDVLARSVRMSAVIESCWRAMGEFDPQRKIKIAVDEWGAFYKVGTELNASNIRGRAVTLRDALAAAMTLDIFHLHADKLLLANFTGLINQEGGLFRAEEEHFVATPIYHVFKMYAAHQGGRSLRTVFDAPLVNYTLRGRTLAVAGLAGSASLKGRQLTLTVVNAHVSQSQESRIVIRGADIRGARVATLTHEDIHAQNTFENPDTVRPATMELQLKGSTVHHQFPAASVTQLTLDLR